MTDRFTSVDIPGSGHEGFMEAGRHAPGEMIAALREIAWHLIRQLVADAYACGFQTGQVIESLNESTNRAIARDKETS